MENKVYSGIGVMSGTSLDGLDMACCEFVQEAGSGKWQYSIVAAETHAYSDAWKEKLEKAYSVMASDYFALHAQYGGFIAEQVRGFISRHHLKPGFIASHGHTVFHRPELGFSTQIGCGATIAAHTGLSTICDFRSLDVAQGGQGAPLVPMGDAHLFGTYSSCLNIGGIANISYQKQGRRLAHDICVANMALNHICRGLGKAYDNNGELARKGSVDEEILGKLNALTLALNKRSIGREFFERSFLPVLTASTVSPGDLLATCSEHSAQQIADALNEQSLSSVLITGGGAYNGNLLERLKKHYSGEVIIPDDHTIQFKEALVFAFLGLLRIEGEINTLSSVTGALQDSVGAAVYRVNQRQAL